jgi:hypothetical protein
LGGRGPDLFRGFLKAAFIRVMWASTRLIVPHFVLTVSMMPWRRIGCLIFSGSCTRHESIIMRITPMAESIAECALLRVMRPKWGKRHTGSRAKNYHLWVNVDVVLALFCILQPPRPHIGILLLPSGEKHQGYRPLLFALCPPILLGFFLARFRTSTALCYGAR